MIKDREHQSSLWVSAITLFGALTLVAGCGGGGGDTDASGLINDNGSDNALVAESAISPVDLSLFQTGALVSSDVVDCTVGDIQTTCYELVMAGFPADQTELGEFCPETTTTTADDAGIWFDGSGEVYDLTGEFMSSSALFDLYAATYGGDWDFVADDEGNIRVTDTEALCRAAAVPNVPEELANFCVECEIDDVGISTTTITIPTTPISGESTTGISDNVGVALNGVLLDGPAPAAAILGGITIAAFDDCAGHVNPVAGYHYHGANLCSEAAPETDGHSSLFGYAMDGFPIYSNTALAFGGEDDDDLDECRGHTDDVRGYHYHAAGTGENMFVGCFSGLTVAAETRGRP